MNEYQSLHLGSRLYSAEKIPPFSPYSSSPLLYSLSPTLTFTYTHTTPPPPPPPPLSASAVSLHSPPKLPIRPVPSDSSPPTNQHPFCCFGLPCPWNRDRAPSGRDSSISGPQTRLSSVRGTPVNPQMGENKREVETDEVDQLLNEIPKATSGNSHYEEFRPKAVLVDSCKGGPHCENFPKNRSPQQRFMASVNGVQNSLAKTAQANEQKLLDEQSLTSAFAKLNVGDALGSQYSKNLCKQNLNVDPQMSSLGSDGISGARIGPNNSDVCWIDSFGLKHHQVDERYRRVDNSTGGISVNNNGVQFVPNLPIHPVELPLANQQQYMVNTQSLLPHLHLPNMDQSQTAWRSIEQENFYKLCHHNLYYQQLMNHLLEAQYRVQPDLTFSSKRQQFFEIPVSQIREQPVEQALLDGYGLTRCLKPQGLILSPDAHAVQDFDRISEQGFAEKHIMRSHGISSLRPAKVGCVNDMINHINQNGKVASNSQLYRSLCGQNDTKCFQDDGLNYLRSCNSRLPTLKYNNCTIDASNRTHLMAKDQHGCRFLQRKISEGGPKDVEKVFIEIIDHIVELMTDPFGNYLVQKLLEVCNEDQQTRVLKVITRNSGDLIRISCDMHGTRVVQKVIETLKTPEQISIVVNSLKPCIVILMKNTNGNHVAQRCLQHLMPEYSQFLFDAAAAYCVELATDRHGCCVLQKCLNYSLGKQRRRIIHEITSNALVLSQDPFGNYVVQYIFELDVPQATNEILNQLEGNYADLSMQKYSSNVVEKCLEYAVEERRDRIIQEVISNPRLDQIMQDPFGNYVIQAVLKCSKGDLKSAIVEAIEAHVPLLRTSPFGKKVLSCNSLKK